MAEIPSKKITQALDFTVELATDLIGQLWRKGLGWESNSVPGKQALAQGFQSSRRLSQILLVEVAGPLAELVAGEESMKAWRRSLQGPLKPTKADSSA